MGKHPKLTVGMATAADAEGVYWTITNLRLDHAEVMPDVEILVIDDQPCTRTDEHVCHSHRVNEFVTQSAQKIQEARRTRFLPGVPQVHSMRYIPNMGAHGTTQARNRIFAEASGEAVLVIDCHVKVWPGALAKLIAYYDSLHDKGNLLHGPLWYDDLSGFASHFDDVIRGNMWGVWGADVRAIEPHALPFEIPGQGLGLFSCRRSDWLGFNPLFRGFGGEEMYIHEKFRREGRTTMCLPFLRWSHRFLRIAGTGYVNDLRHRVRNYLIGYRELGLPIDRLRRYFRDGIPEDKEDSPARGRIPAHEWELLCLDLGIDP